MKALEHHYNTLVKYLNFEDIEIVIATGCGFRSDIENSKYPKEAYKLGREL